MCSKKTIREIEARLRACEKEHKELFRVQAQLQALASVLNPQLELPLGPEPVQQKVADGP